MKCSRAVFTSPCSFERTPRLMVDSYTILLDLLGLVHTLLPVATLPVLNPEAAYIRDFSHRRGGRQSCLHETFLYRECCSYEWSDEPLVVVFAKVDVVFPTCGRASLVLT